MGRPRKLSHPVKINLILEKETKESAILIALERKLSVSRLFESLLFKELAEKLTEKSISSTNKKLLKPASPTETMHQELMDILTRLTRISTRFRSILPRVNRRYGCIGLMGDLGLWNRCTVLGSRIVRRTEVARLNGLTAQPLGLDQILKKLRNRTTTTSREMLREFTNLGMYCEV